MKKLLLSAAIFLGIAGAADAAAINCQVYTSQPSGFTVGTQPVVPCDQHGAVWIVGGGGGGGGTSSNYGDPFPTVGTAVGASDGTNMVPFLVDGSGNLKVNVAAGGAAGGTSSTFNAAFPGTGTAAGMSDGTNMVPFFTPDGTNLAVIAEQSGSWTIDAVQSGTWTVDATQSGSWDIDNITGTVSLPTGAATAAKQPAFGTAGTPSADVLSVQAISGGVAFPVTGTFWQATQPISAASLPLPSGAATAAKQPAFSVAGTPSADVLTIQGDPAGEPIPVTGSFSATTSAVATASPPTYVEGTENPLSMDLSGNIRTLTSVSVDTTAVATASDPTYSEGVAEPISQTLDGRLRVDAVVNATTSAVATASPPTYGEGTTEPQSMDLSGATRVLVMNGSSSGAVNIQDGGNSITVDNGGTFAVQAAQSGTWNIGNITGSITLPTGAAIAAKQPALGTFGSPSSDVISIQGDSSGEPVPISAVSLPLPAGAAIASKQPSLGSFGAPSADVISIQGDPTGSDVPVLANQSGTWTITGISGSISLPTGAATAAKQPALGSAGSPSTDVISVQGVSGGQALPISATSLPLPSGAATATNLTGGGQKTQIVDGSGNVIGATANALDINIKSGNPSTLPAGTNSIGKVATQSNVGGATTDDVSCGSSVVYDASTNGSTELVALSSGQTIYVCGYSIMAGGTVNVKLIYGTGTACASSPSNMTPAWQLTAQAGLVDGADKFRGLKTAASNALCINTSAGVAVQAIVYYTKF